MVFAMCFVQTQLLEGDYDPVAEYQRRYAQAVKDLERDNMDNHEKVKESEASCWVCFSC
jgi:hypothetical protein